MNKQVKAWKETVHIPTYEVGRPEKNPVFLENRVYQGSSGVVYPYPVIESMADEPTDHAYQAVFLENEYIKVMILPELGGRVQMAYDKIRQRHFIYYNRVIKPALVGLAGPWISGGIEFNWPQHHRPSTFLPVDCCIEEGGDGSVTVWVNERERMFHQQGQAGFRLRPGCAYLEVRGRLYNPTEVPQTFLWWANPAVAVNDAYQSVFPPDVNAVFDHGKRAVSTFPIATGTYYKMDYSAGVDISNYKNIYVPTSYMVARSKYDFEGGYENDTQAGMLHVADHHFSPGKKQWTWGNGDFGRAWDRNLTDEDGPYIELMAGVYTENQPDFSWLMPYEEKSFVQYFLPYRELGRVQNASKDFLIAVDTQGFKVFATSRQEVRVVLHTPQGVLYDQIHTVSPEAILERDIPLSPEQLRQLQIDLIQHGRTVLSRYPESDEIQPVPDAAEAALKPEEIKTNEQLFLTGLHLEQYRHATWSAWDYYEEALRRDPLDVRCNNAAGLWLLRRGRFVLAEQHFRTAVRVLQKRNPNPYDGEPLYNLGLSLKYQAMQNGDPAKMDEAYDWFYKSTWNKAWQDAGYMACAQISTLRGEWETALEEVEKALLSGWHNHKARALKTALLRHLGREEECRQWAAASLEINLFNYAVLFETGQENEMRELMRSDANNYDELALDYVAAGLYDSAMAVWDIAEDEKAVTPMTYYYRAWIGKSASEKQQAALQPQDFCFPNRVEAVMALSSCTDDARACYYLGNFYYDRRQYELAQSLWEHSATLEPDFPTVWRNLALVWFNKRHDASQALACMEKAFRLDSDDARIFMELDQLYKRMQYPHSERLAIFEKYPSLVLRRDDLVLEKATLLNQLGRHEEAKSLIDNRIFHPWEGGEGKVSGQYQISRIGLAENILRNDNATQSLEYALNLLLECLSYPANLGEGKLYGAQDNDVYYLLGRVCQRLGRRKEALDYWQRGTQGPTEPAAALYYNDAKPDKIFYAALCYQALASNGVCPEGDKKARSLFHKLISYAEKHLFDHVTMDYFAVSLPDLLVWDGDLDEQNRFHCSYLLALGYAGLGEGAKAWKYLDQAVGMDANHQGLMSLRAWMSDNDLEPVLN